MPDANLLSASQSVRNVIQKTTRMKKKLNCESELQAKTERVLNCHRSKSLDKTVAAPGCFRQKQVDQCYIEKYLQSQVHPQLFALV